MSDGCRACATNISLPAWKTKISRNLAGFRGIFMYVQAIAGHADIQTTMNRYVHQQSDRIVETGKRVTDLFVQKCARREVRKALQSLGLRHVKKIIGAKNVQKRVS